MNKPLIHILCFLTLALNCFGQDNYIFNTRHLSVEDGLLGRRVNDIIEDKEGFIWIATNEGLNRFDGYEFQHFTKKSHGLSSNQIYDLEIDDKGLLWMFFANDENYQYQPALFNTQTYQLQSFKDQVNLSKKDITIPFIYHDKIGKKIILSQRNQRYEYHSSTGLKPITNLIYSHFDKETYWKLEQHQVTQFNTQNQIIQQFNYPNITLRAILSVNDKTLSLLGSENGSVIIKQSLKGGEIKKETYSDLIINKKSQLFSTKDILHIPYQDTVLYFDSRTIMTNRQHLDNLMIDNNGMIWIGTDDGLFLVNYQKSPFKRYLQNAADKYSKYDGRGLWINQDYLYSYSRSDPYRWDFKNKKKKKLFIPRKKSTQSVRAVATNTGNELWVAGHLGAIFQIDTLTGDVINKIPTSPDLFSWSIFQDNQQKWYSGDDDEGVFFYDKDTSTAFYPYPLYNGFEALKSSKIIHFLEDKGNPNYFWIASTSGWYLAHSDKGIIQRFWSKGGKKHQIPGNDIHYIYQENDNTYWLGTAFSGLIRVELSDDFTVKKVRSITTKDGLSSNTIYAIFEDKSGYLWLSSKNGIVKIDKTTFQIQVFLEEDGLPHYEFNRGSAFQRNDGTIFFGTLNGIVGFHPDDFNNQLPYNVSLKITNGEQYISKTDKIEDVTRQVLKNKKIILHPNDRFFTLSVALQDYFYISKLKYAYKIEGFQKAFNITKDRKISISGLPYGTYNLIIRGIGKDNRYSTEEINIPIVVLRPFYLQWWFISLVVVIIGITIWQALIWRIKSLKDQQKILEGIVKRRTQQLENQAEVLEKDKKTIEAQAEELRSLDEMKSRFFTNISHELRTPLTLILSPITTMLNSQTLNNRNFTYAMIVQQNAQKLLKRTNEILDLSKLEAEAIQLKPIPTNFYDFVKRLAAAFESFAQQKGQELTFNYQLNKNLKILLDQDKFEHIFNNYLSNAIKYTANDGKIEVSLSEKQVQNLQKEWDNQIILKVKDNGNGIDEDNLSKVFDRFYQVQNTENKAGSSGIGLALSKEIAQLMNGQLRLESEVGKGSSFYFEMPYIEYLGVIEVIKTNNLTDVNLLQSATQNLTLNDGLPTILLVEDNPELRQYIQLVLSEKYQVTTAENGKEALERLTNASLDDGGQRENLPSLIISDIMMPIMNGFELLESVKSNDALRNIPMIMLTARAELRDRLKALRIGVDDYLVKPFQEIELIARIDNLLENYEERKAIIKAETPRSTNSSKQSVQPISNKNAQWLAKLETTVLEEMTNSIFSVDYLADLLDLNRNTLYKKVKMFTGLTPNQYITTIRLRQAKILLEDEQNLTVNEVAQKVGIQSAGYLTKLFKKEFGKLPSDYL